MEKEEPPHDLQRCCVLCHFQPHQEMVPYFDKGISNIALRQCDDSYQLWLINQFFQEYSWNNLLYKLSFFSRNGQRKNKKSRLQNSDTAFKFCCVLPQLVLTHWVENKILLFLLVPVLVYHFLYPRCSTQHTACMQQVMSTSHV